ncbi:hypothetical protein C8F04DRAFT_1290550 [Mycena alexandri]|uniref:Uncharacterized protein n=1 Tax=Mycena alexandri TaxID=1745969 RepID=A0AAD6SJW1_9AGAR|nr:hypothetical protein C8F04DRAFT_1290550 [Mycena alexandri]
MSPPLHNARPVTTLPPAPPGYVSCAGHRYYDGQFQSEEAHSRRKDRHFWLVSQGPQQGFYSRQSSALQNTPAGYSLNDALERFDTHSAMHNAWPRHCHHYHSHCRVHFACVHVPCNEHPDAPTNADIHTAAAANRTLHAVLTSASRASSSMASRPPTALSAPPLPPSASRTPAPSNAHTSTSRSTAAQSPLLPPPYSSPPPNQDTPMPSPSPSPPASNGPQPMRMRTGIPESKRAHREEGEHRAHAGAEHEARAAVQREAQAAVPPRRIASVEITHAPSAGVTISVVPKPEPESDAEPDAVVERQEPRAWSIKRKRELSPCAPLFDPDSEGDAADVEMQCISSSRSPSPPPPSSVAPSTLSILSSTRTPPSVISIASTAPSVISVSSTSSLSASIPSTGGPQEPEEPRVATQAAALAQPATAAAGATGPAPRSGRPAMQPPLAACPPRATQPTLLCSAHPSPAPRSTQPQASRAALSPAMRPSQPSASATLHASSRSISVANSSPPNSGLRRLDFTHLPPYGPPPVLHRPLPPPALPQPHRNPTSFVPSRTTSIFWVSESYRAIFLNSDHAYEDAGSHRVQLFQNLEDASVHSERHSLPGGLPHEFPQSAEHRAASNQQTLRAFVCMEFTFVPYEPGAEQPKKSNKPKKTPSSTTARASAVDNLPANSSTSTPTVTDIAAPEAAPGIDLTAPAPTSVLGPPPSALEPPAPTPPVLQTNTRPVPSSSVLNDVNIDDDDSNDEGTSKKKKHKKDDFVEIPQDGVPPEQAGVKSWHGRNPDRPAIPLRNHRPKQNVETLETARLKRAANKQTAAKLTDAIQNIIDVRNKMAEEVAEAHNVKVELVLRRLLSLGSMKASRKISLFNAKVHHLCKRQKLSMYFFCLFHAAQEAHPEVGRPIKLKEARRRVRLDPEWEDMDEEAEQALRDELMQHHELKKHGARATPTACMVDERFTTESIAQEMTALAERTGMIGFGFFTRTHIHDKTVPIEIESWGALEFFPQVLRMDPRDIGAKFELWAIARDQGKSVSSSGKEVVQYHEEGIKAKGRKSFCLNWKQYWTVMVMKHRLILRGWPLHVISPVPGPIPEYIALVQSWIAEYFYLITYFTLSWPPPASLLTPFTLRSSWLIPEPLD